MVRMFTTGLFAMAAVAALFGATGGTAAARSGAAPIDWASLDLTDIRGAPLDASAFAGKVVLVVNTASRCAFTPQYDALEALWDRYGDRGLVVLGVPSNDFGNQEPGSNAEIASFCQSTFGVSFPMTGKAPVTGPHAHPVFAWARDVAGRAAVPGWNFHKILIGRDGTFRAAFPSFQKPDSRPVVGAVEEALAEAPAM
jgi:glutathione peroxidase